MSLKDRAQPPRPSHPKGWEPGISWDGGEGELSTGPIEAGDEPLWDNLIEDWGFDPKAVSVVDGSVQVRAWDANMGGEIVRLKYYRCRIEQTRVNTADLEELIAMVKRRRPPAKVPTDLGEKALVVALSDWQVGKAGEVNGGTPEFLERLLATMDRVYDRAKKLRKEQGIDTVYLVGLGDMIENCDGHYAAQTFNVDLDRRSQVRLVRQLIMQIIDQFVGQGFRVVIGAVPGNHGENRRGGKAFTNVFTDNDDLAVFEQIAEIMAHNAERYANVSVPSGAIAEDHTMTLDVAGVAVGFAHGHQIKGGAPLWWQKQAHGRQEIGSADILVSGHFHHLIVNESSGRTWMQCPAMDGGSRWYTAQSGASAPSGMLTFVAGSGCGERGWSDLAVL